MIEILIVILLLLWIAGLWTGYVLGGFIYILLVVALVLFLVRVVSGRAV